MSDGLTTAGSVAATGRATGWATWRLAVLLAIPAFLPLVAHYVGFFQAGLWPTGFLIYDTPYYMANGREHFDDGTFSLTYANPFSFDYASPKIYFQPLTLLLGALDRIPGTDPGLVFALVGVVAAIVCARVAIALFESFADRSSRAGKLSLIAFFWGGGIVVLTATLLAFLPGAPSWWYLTRTADPVGGWWFLNLGRNFVLPTEAVYHALFLGTVVLLIARKFAAALATMAILSVSHPFTGVQLAAIVGAWTFVERIVLRNRDIPWWLLAGTAAVGICHIGYYLVFLTQFPEHRQVQEQWTLRWTMAGPHTVIAYGLVAAAVAIRMRTGQRAREVLAQWPNRLLVAWVVVSLALENHDLFLNEPIQPVHFTRGYTWIGLFLLGAPTWVRLFDRVRLGRTRVAGALAAAALLALLIVDNVVWFGAQTTQAAGLQLGRELHADSVNLGYALTDDQRELFAWMNDDTNRRTVVLSEDETVGYLLTAYTPLRSWRSHYANTPWNRRHLDELRAFFRSGMVIDEWRKLPMLIVFRDSADWRSRAAGFAPVRLEQVFKNGSYTAVRVVPVGRLTSGSFTESGGGIAPGQASSPGWIGNSSAAKDAKDAKGPLP